VKAPASIRFVGAGKPPRVAPFGLAWSEDGEAVAVRVAGDEALDAVPEAGALPPGTLVLVLPEAERGRGLFEAFGRRTVSRAARCGALLVRGYVELGAEVEPKSKLDLVFGRAP
jgi:hypothetical protein